MADGVFSRGFRGRRRAPSDVALPPGQYVTEDFPVFSAGPTPHTPLDEWSFALTGEAQPAAGLDLGAVPRPAGRDDHHRHPLRHALVEARDAVEGVSVDALLDEVEHDAAYVTAFCDGGYTTNLPLEEVTDGKAWIAYEFDGAPLEPEHGAPARLLVPHLYLWKSAKWVRGLRLMDEDEPGFWESLGYHNHGDPWKEERHWGD